MSSTTLVILKPDCYARWLVWEVTKRIESTWLKLVGTKVLHLIEEVLREHYAHIADKPFFPSVQAYMQSWPVVIQAWRGENAVPVVRKLIGVTNALDAAPWTVRGDFALNIDANVIHASEDESFAEIELKRFFNEGEVIS